MIEFLKSIKSPHDIFASTFIIVSGLIFVRGWTLIRSHKLTWRRSVLVVPLLFLSFVFYALSTFGAATLLFAAICLGVAVLMAVIPRL